MKKSLLCFLSFVTFSLFAQNATVSKLSYSEVVEVKAASAKILNERATDFLQAKRMDVKTIPNAINSIGTLNVTYTSIKKGPESGYVKFTFRITIKDGKYKIEMSDFKHEGIQGKSSGGAIDLEKPECGETLITKSSWMTIKDQTPVLLKTFVQELKTKMENPAKATPANTDF